MVSLTRCSVSLLKSNTLYYRLVRSPSSLKLPPRKFSLGLCWKGFVFADSIVFAAVTFYYLLATDCPAIEACDV